MIGSMQGMRSSFPRPVCAGPPRGDARRRRHGRLDLPPGGCPAVLRVDRPPARRGRCGQIGAHSLHSHARGDPGRTLADGRWGAGRADRGRPCGVARGQAAAATWAVASAAARIRGELRLPLPDALIIASALDQQAQLLVTNDAAWLRATPLGARVVLLDSISRSRRS